MLCALINVHVIKLYLFICIIYGGFVMANADTIFGARLAGHLQGSTANAQVRPYTVLATDAVALFMGDFVKLTGTSADGDDGLNHPVVAQAAATETLVGWVVGFKASSDYLNQVYRTASTLRTVYVCDDPYSTFEIQASSDAAIIAADICLNADITVGSGSTSTGLSGMELDQTSLTSSTAQLRILAVPARPDNVLGLHAKLICMINEHQYKTTAGV